MGAFWSKKENEFEKALERIDKNITQIEVRQKTAHLNRRRFITYIVYISVLSQLIIVAWYYFHRKPISLLDKIIDASPLIYPILLGLLIRYIITFYYTRRIKSDNARLHKLRAELKLRLDDRKREIQFDKTQQLLSKYEKLAQDDDTPTSPKIVNIPNINNNNNNSNRNNNRNNKGGSQIRQRPPPTPSPSNPPPVIINAPAIRPAVPPSALPPNPNQISHHQQNPQQQHPQQMQQQMQPNMPLQNLPNARRLQQQRSWMDKLVDFVVGGDPEHSVALICQQCKAHNGLIPPSEANALQFRCRFCNFFNQNGEPEPQRSPTPPPPPLPIVTPSTTSSSSSPKGNENKKGK